MASPLPHTRSATVTSLQDDSAVLVLQDGQTLTWPRSLLPMDLTIGDTIQLVALAHSETSDAHARLARAMLNEFLRDSSV
jgi:hypothetical protein